VKLVDIIININHEYLRKDICEFRTVSIATSYEAFLGIVIVGTREEVTKGEFWVPNLLSGVLFN
jgi:hypothetical protein